MTMAPRRHPLTASIMAAVMTATSLPMGAAQAGMVSTHDVIRPTVAEQPSRAADAAEARARVQALLARQDVRAQMIALGVDPEEARARIAAMTESELQALAGRLDQLPAGAGVGTILVILFVVFGVAVLLDALGIWDILPFVCGPGQCGSGQQALNQEPAAGPAPEYQYYPGDQAPAYRPPYGEDPYARRSQPRYETEEYYQPGYVPPQRNYYEERFGTQRQIR